MSSCNIMYRTMFLLSDNTHQGTSHAARLGTTPNKKLHASYSNVCEKDFNGETPSTVLCGGGNAFILSLPENKNASPKLLIPYSSLDHPNTNDFSMKKVDLLVGDSLNSAPLNPDHRVSYSEDRDTVEIPLSGHLLNKQIKERPHSCEDCGKTFLLKHHLVTHARVHSGERPHVCGHCGKTFAHKHCLSTHLLLHTSDRPYTCPECNKSFTLKHHLVTHARVHSRDRPYVCQECGRAFSQKRHLVTHTKFHSGERPFVCSECGESFAQEEHLVLHSRFHGETRPYHCQECGVSFARKFELVDHSRIHGRVPFSCAACGKEFLQKRSFQAHLRLHNALEGAKHAYCCIHCGETFDAKEALAAHSCGDREKNFVCRECGNSFLSREGLSLHLRLHAGDRSFVPDLCSLAAAFQQQHPGITPMFGPPAPKEMSPQTQEKTSNQQREVLPTTNEEHVPNVRSIAVPKPIIPKTFSVHLKPKPHVCQECGRAFAQKHGLIQHSKRYTNGGCDLRRFACDKCGKAFLQKNHLVLHERQHLAPQERNGSALARAKAVAQQVDVPVERTKPPSPAPHDDVMGFD